MDDQTPVQDDVQLTPSTNGQDSDQATILLSLEEMIKSNITSIDKLREEIKLQQQMFTDSFNNDPVFIENQKQVKEISKTLKTTRENIRKQPAVAILADKIKSMRLDLKERMTALSDYLQEYQRMTGATEIECADGDIREIVNSSKLIKRSAINK